MARNYFLLFTFLFIFEPLLSDTWLAKAPTIYTCRGGDYLAEVFPKMSRLKNKKPICFFYKHNSNEKYNKEYSPERRYKLIWKCELTNRTAPNDVIISPNGYLVTLDEHAFLGGEHSLVIYNKNGKIVKDFWLSDLIPEVDQDKIARSVSSSHWRREATYYFGNPNYKHQAWYNPSHLYIVLAYKKVIEIVLENGHKSYGDFNNYTYLDSLHSEDFVNEKALVWASSIEYSSITELVNCKKSK